MDNQELKAKVSAAKKELADKYLSEVFGDKVRWNPRVLLKAKNSDNPLLFVFSALARWEKNLVADALGMNVETLRQANRGLSKKTKQEFAAITGGLIKEEWLNASK